MAGPVVMGVLGVPAIGFLVRFYVALARDHARHAHHETDVVKPVPPGEVVECLIWRS